MRRDLNHALRLGAVLAAGSLLAIGSGSVAEGQELPALEGTINVVPASTEPGTVVVATATFTNLAGAPDPPWGLAMDMFDTGGAGTFDPTSITESGVTGCFLLDPQIIFCDDWTPTTAGETATISVNIIVADDAAPASPGWSIEAVEGVDPLAVTNLEIVAAPTTPTTTAAPVDPPAVNPPASGGTTAAAPTQLPATGASMWPFVLVGFLALAAGAGALRLSRSD